jgi:hypothetical protein
MQAVQRCQEHIWERWPLKWAGILAVVLGTFWPQSAFAIHIDFSVFNDHASYSGVLLQQGRVALDADWNETGAIQNGQPWGDFRFVFDPGSAALAGTQGIVGGLAVGSASGNGTLGGDQGFTLNLSPGLGVTAFGAIVSFDDPSFLDFFRLIVNCPDQDCAFSPPPPDASLAGSGSFFLGVIAQPGFAFDRVTLEAVIPRDSQGNPTAVVPGWQVAGISYVPVPEPATLFLVGIAFASLAAARRRKLGS